MTLSLNPEIQNLLKKVFRFAKKKKVSLYIVGGYVRDIILKREKTNPDIDFSLKKSAIHFGRQLARILKAGFVVLDKVHGCCRLVKKINEKAYTLDFTDFRGATLKEDLGHRDFTINALGLELKKILTPTLMHRCGGVLIDPYGGIKDLKAKLIRIVNKKGFDEDPLRILRAFSLACIFGFKIDKETLRLIIFKKNKLSKVSFERIRDELFKILDSRFAFDYLSWLDKFKILKIIIPEIEGMRAVKQGPYHHLDVLRHTLETVKQLEGLFRELKNNNQIQAHLNEVISGERRRKALIKLGALLHDIGKPKALRHIDGKTTFYGHERMGLEISEDIARRLKLSNAELDSLKKMVCFHLRPGYLADNREVSRRGKFRYFRDTACEAVSVLLISLADQRATKGRLTTKESRHQHEKVCLSLIKEYFKRKEEKQIPRLINGDDLIKRFKLEPSPLIGKILAEIEELQAIGKIKTKHQAFLAAKKFIK